LRQGFLLLNILFLNKISASKLVAAMVPTPKPLSDSKLLDVFNRLERENQASDIQAWQDLENCYGATVFSRMLFLLTRKHFDQDQARRHWYRILEHSRDMDQALGRKLGLRVAMFDYLVNVAQKFLDPLLVEGDTYRQKESSAYRDELTGLYNRRFFNRVLHQQVAEAQRFDQPFSLVMFDVDEFKTYNDLYGHLAGDKALAQVASVLTATARKVDQIIRYGGDEFLLILPRVNRAEAMVAAERHRRAVERIRFSSKTNLPGVMLTLSAGVASYPLDAQSAMDLVHRADMALYSAKHHGRNCVASAGPERRKHPRVKHVALVHYRPSVDGHEFYQGETRDISFSGLGLAVKNPVQKDQPMELVFRTDRDGAVLKVQGRAVHSSYNTSEDQPYTLGIRVDGAESSTYQNTLLTLLERNSRQIH
jgi:diguanylate cyclase (GGDEF)-like protein